MGDKEPVLGLAETEIRKELLLHHTIAVFERILHLGAQERLATRAVPVRGRRTFSAYMHVRVRTLASGSQDDIDAVL